MLPLASLATRIGVRIFAAERRPLARRRQGEKYSLKAKLPSKLGETRFLHKNIFDNPLHFSLKNDIIKIWNSINSNRERIFMKNTWKGSSLLHKSVTVISILASLGVIAASVLQIFDVWEQAVNVCVPLMGVVMLCQAYMQWNTNRKVAYFSIGTAVFVFACSVVVFFVK